MSMKDIKARPEHRAFRDDLLGILRKHAGHLRADEMLAISAHVVGQIIAMQDKRTISRDAALMMVMANMEVGNREAMAGLMDPKGNG